MESFGSLGKKQYGSLRRLLAQIVLISLVIGSFQVPAHAAGNACHTSSPSSAAYTVTVCITAPVDGATISGVRNITATVAVNPAGANPGVAKLIFYLGGTYLLPIF